MTDNDELKETLYEVHMLDFVDHVFVEQRAVERDPETNKVITEPTIYARISSTKTVALQDMEAFNDRVQQHSFQWQGIKPRDGGSWLVITEQPATDD